MKIRKLKIENFKSFKKLDLNFESINILIGSNASGKSNFLKIFQFIKEIVDWGLENAISMQGGPEYLLNVNLRDDFPLKLYILSDVDWIIKTEFETKVIGVYYTNIEYEFEIKFDKEKFQILKDKLNIFIKIGELKDKNEELNEEELEKLPNFQIQLSKKGEKIDLNYLDLSNKEIIDKFSISNESLSKLFSNIFSKNIEIIDANNLLINNSTSYSLIGLPLFSDFMIYEFDGKSITEAKPFLGLNQLEDDGYNLTIVLKNILNDSEKSRMFYNVLNTILPYLKQIQVEKVLDSSFFLRIKESYSEIYLPGSLSSEGTVIILALIVALYFEDYKITLFEEPAKSVHPHLISKIVDLFLDVSHEKQIFASTHNPLLIKQLDLKSLFLVSRNKEGFSEIKNLNEIDQIKVFLKNELGIEDLFIDNLLGDWD